MSNLEKLSLYCVYNNGRIIDGDDLKKTILSHMTRLKKFTFDTFSIIQHTDQIISYDNYFPEANECHCHIYSKPYTLTYYRNITNNFFCGLFKSVVKLSLYDEYSFEHEFFLRIAQSFSFMKKLTVYNWKAQKNNNQQ